ncbi:MAG TPA: SDR family oxidoreductase [Casimicrobium huifangae]|mgnify:FL=1|jgi:NAD(P)-dependent dehydrogenase (short-subunit alcohol dehydrogenase family)|uniref:SDR family oxidoreductase n=1 Tax=Casimicrobium huifangae TaxID=2591109 RepID=UPI0012EBD165|nr:SDR family oxidoreductase [Casimicrobium huifangae]HQA33392.1 SDR family oxidoreductase [Casimicrobium huifangae]HQD63587.1 SDR family oxidoreductase [Casimicrobium huifangae]
MTYFVTGASGFIGKRLVRKLLARKNSTVYFLIRAESKKKVDKLLAFWGEDAAKRCIPVVGDLAKPFLGVHPNDRAKLKGKIKHFFHLAAVYDMTASAEDNHTANVLGTEHAVALANEIKAGLFHHMSSIAVAGNYEGVFREDMFDEAKDYLDHPYMQTKHESEAYVREHCTMPWRAYRPAIVLGDSKTGEIDKIDGPYYFFKLLQRMRSMLPPWMPTIGIEGGRVNMVPVDFVVDATDHIAHSADKTLNKRAFHLTDPAPLRIGDSLNIFARAAHAPQMTMRINAALFGFIPQSVMKGMMALPPVRRIKNAVMKDLGIPDDVLGFINYPVRFDCRDTLKALEGTKIAVPELDTYAARLWDYWERNLDPDLFIDRTLKGQVEGKVILITGGTSGIGQATALKIAEAGSAKAVIVCGRDQEKIDETLKLAKKRGVKIVAYSADVSDEVGCAEFAKKLHENHGGVDILVNNAGRSIRRALEHSYDRFHDFERTMQVNYFGALRITMALLPHMSAQKRGHVINISSIGVLTNAPRFSAYVASKAALDAWTRCASSEYSDRGISFTTINMPLVKTPMIAPTKIYNNVPTLEPDEAADMIIRAIVYKPVRIATRLGVFGQVLHAFAPRIAQIVMNTSFRMFGDSDAAKGKKNEVVGPSADQLALSNLMRGIHF